MALVEDVIFSDPVLQRIFFEKRRFAARSDSASSLIAGLGMAISEHKVEFQKAKEPALAEYWQRKMRAAWFEIRRLCDGYFMTLPAGHNDGCEHVTAFEHENGSLVFHPNYTARAAYWYKYAQKSPPPWGETTYGTPRRRRRRRRSRRRHRYLSTSVAPQAGGSRRAYLYQ